MDKKNVMKSQKEKLTKEEAVRRHRELWNKTAELVEKEKYKVTKEPFLPEGYTIKNDCWCCEFAHQNRRKVGWPAYSKCLACPIKFSDTSTDDISFIPCIDDPKSPYLQWIDIPRTYLTSHKDVEKLINLAKAIANLPERELPFKED